MRPMDYSQEKYAEFNIHTITALIPTDAVRLVGGFDEQAPGWEDWTLYLRLAMAGQCGHYVRGPIFVYRDHLSINHFDDVAAGRALMDRVTAPYRTERGDIPMSKCCGAPSSPRAAALAAVAPLGAPIPTDAGMVTLEYVGPSSGTFIAKVPGTGRQYRIGRNATVRYVIVPPEDVDFLMMAYELVRVMPTPAPVSAPEPVVAVPPPVDVTATVEAESTATTTTTKTRTKTASS
jgi:hypothetical protein